MPEEKFVTNFTFFLVRYSTIEQFVTTLVETNETYKLSHRSKRKCVYSLKKYLFFRNCCLFFQMILSMLGVVRKRYSVPDDAVILFQCIRMHKINILNTGRRYETWFVDYRIRCVVRSPPPDRFYRQSLGFSFVVRAGGTPGGRRFVKLFGNRNEDIFFLTIRNVHRARDGALRLLLYFPVVKTIGLSFCQNKRL